MGLYPRLSPAVLAVTLCVGAVCGVPAARAGQSLERVSVPDPSTGQVQGNATSEEVSVTPDGRYVAFSSLASNLVPGDTNARKDVFVRDRVAGTTERVSLPDPVTMPAQSQGDGHGSWSGMSDDGCRVVFVSYSANLVPGDLNSDRDVFVRDRCSTPKRTLRVSVPATSGTNPFCILGPSPLAYISGDGRYVSFASYATNLVPGCTQWFMSHVYLRDLQTGTTELVDRSPAGAVSSRWSWGGNLSADGRFVTFSSLGANLVAGDSNGQADVFLRDRQNNTVEIVNRSSSGQQANAESVSSFSGKSRVITPDGRYLVFRSLASNLVAGDTNAKWDVFVRDRQAATTERASTTDSGAQANAGNEAAQISADGRYVSFQSQATNLDVRDADTAWDVYVKDRQSGDVDLVSVNEAGQSTNDWVDDPAMSPDGRYVVWADYGTNLIPGDTNGAGDALFADRNAVPPPTNADLAISKSHPGNLVVGANTTYTIRVRNVGTASAPGPVTVTDTLPAGLTLVAAVGGDWSCVEALCTYGGSVAPGAAAPDISLTVTVGEAAVPAATNSAAVSCACGDTNPLNDFASDPASVVAPDRVAISVTGGPTYTLGERAISAGGFTVLKNANGTVKSVTGTATVPGANGGDATVTFQVNQFFTSDRYTGFVRISDPGAGLGSLQSQLLYVPVSALSDPNGASATQTGLYTARLPWTRYTLTWTMRDPG